MAPAVTAGDNTVADATDNSGDPPGDHVPGSYLVPSPGGPGRTAGPARVLSVPARTPRRPPFRAPPVAARLARSLRPDEELPLSPSGPSVRVEGRRRPSPRRE
ncbi:hypothetical protein Sru01_11060 [Sphaerisporangium rufum]|uniref:Uncharacterized protein n=1 Tax=Sphaerisporangium rufum TaxID=1381558 RepID=A0A919UXR6_9ACTN|nr:hypothetical protein Sru01_11060 [Sphaerisporangium rufum]